MSLGEERLVLAGWWSPQWWVGRGGGCSLRLLVTPVLRKWRDKCLLVLGSLSPFYSLRDTSPWNDDTHTQGGSSFHVHTSLKTSSQTPHRDVPQLILSPIKLTIKINLQERKVKS